MGRIARWGRLAGRHRLVVGGLLVALVAGIGATWASRRDRVVLFTGLEPADVGAIVAELEQANVRWDVARDGTTIRVPAERVGEMRLRVASRGLTGPRTLGYELLDRASAELPEYLQRVNHRRALEGELGRTIASIAEVRSARVHLAIPESRTDGAPPTASAVVELEPGAQLAGEQVRGIVALISGSVEGLSPSGVTLVDSRGRGLAHGSEMLDGSDPLRLQRDVEEHLREKASSLLEQVVGPGQVVVQVHADLDFERVERSIETWDPASSVVRSEEVDGDATTTSWEIDRTVAKVLGAVGTVRRLSVAVLVNGTFEERPDGELEYVERSPEELATLSAVVRDAVGWDDARGDRLEMANLRFAEAPDPTPSPSDTGGPPREGRWTWLALVGIAAAAGAAAWALPRRATAPEPGDAGRPAEASRGPERSVVPEAALRKEAIREEMHALAKERPGEVAQVLRGWLVEEKSS